MSTVVLSGIGAIVSAYGIWQHYAPVGSAICNINALLSCDIVNKSPWSEFFGIPVALVGLGGYAVLGVLALAALRGQRQWQVVSWLAVLSSVGLAIQGSLTIIEFRIIGVACPICIVSQVAILGITASAWIAWAITRNNRRKLPPV